MKYHIENELIIITLIGIYSVDEMLALTREAIDNPESAVPARILVDASDSKAVRNQQEIEQVAATVSQWKNDIDKIAVYVTSDVHFGAMQLGTALSELSSFDVAPFRSYEEAVNFLKQP